MYHRAMIHDHIKALMTLIKVSVYILAIIITIFKNSCTGNYNA